jgi:hypothetical protein
MLKIHKISRQWSQILSEKKIRWEMKHHTTRERIFIESRHEARWECDIDDYDSYEWRDWINSSILNVWDKERSDDFRELFKSAIIASMKINKFLKILLASLKCRDIDDLRRAHSHAYSKSYSSLKRSIFIIKAFFISACHLSYISLRQIRIFVEFTFLSY